MKFKNLKIGFVFCFLLQSQFSLSDEKIDFVAQFLQTATQDAQFNNNTDLNRFITEHQPKNNIIDDMELRIRQDQTDNKNDMEYELRFQPKSLFYIHDEDKHYGILKKQTKTQQDLSLSSALLNRYTLLLNGRFHLLKLTKLNKLIELSKSKIKALKKLSKLADFEILRYLNAQQKLKSLQVDAFEAQISYQNIKTRIDQYMIMDKNRIVSNWLLKITPLLLESLSSAQPWIQLENNPKILSSRLALQEKQQVFKNQKHKDSKILSFVQFGYKPSNKEKSIGIGIKIPLTTKWGKSVASSHKDKITAQNALLNDYTSTQITIINLIKNLQTYYQHIKIFDDNSLSKATYQKYAKTRGADALLLLNLKENYLNDEIKLLNYQHKFFIDYIRLLNITGKLLKKPFDNILKPIK
ncbi:MAG: hypothetical protein DRQ51_03070 [Gammaproteobacteria bacterium]|nr:MAG: hypothetical protein DRQ51_03070 [Gammaproteobacteria bacterium]